MDRFGTVGKDSILGDAAHIKRLLDNAKLFRGVDDTRAVIYANLAKELRKKYGYAKPLKAPKPVTKELPKITLRDIVMSLRFQNESDRPAVYEQIKKTPWFNQFKQHYGEEPDLNTKDYDYYKAWKSGVRPSPEADHTFFNPATKKTEQEYRWSDKFKGGRYINPTTGAVVHDKMPMPTPSPTTSPLDKRTLSEVLSTIGFAGRKLNFEKLTKSESAYGIKGGVRDRLSGGYGSYTKPRPKAAMVAEAEANKIGHPLDSHDIHYIMAGQPPLTPTEKVRMQAERDSRAKATKEAEEAARQASLKADAEELIRRKSAKDKRAMDTIMQHREYFKQYPDRAAHAIRNAGAYAKYPDLASFTNRPEMWEIPHSQHMAKVRGYTNYQNYKTSLFNTPEEFYKSGWWR